jgi:pseudouridine-5'-phosphate glycosidase
MLWTVSWKIEIHARIDINQQTINNSFFRWNKLSQLTFTFVNCVVSDALIKKSIDDALNEADKLQIRGKDVTPFILAAVSKITSGKSLQTSMKFDFDFTISTRLIHCTVVHFPRYELNKEQC